MDHPVYSIQEELAGLVRALDRWPVQWRDTTSGKGAAPVSLKETLVDDMKTAMKAKDAETLGALRMAKAKFIEFETSGKGGELDDEAVIGILKLMIKQRNESARVYRENDRIELADKEEREIRVLEKYLPAAIPEETVRQVVAEAVSQTGASSPKDMGKVMGAVMGRLKTMDGLVDGALVQKLVKESLIA